jgi:hypothetical protein
VETDVYICADQRNRDLIQKIIGHFDLRGITSWNAGDGVAADEARIAAAARCVLLILSNGLDDLQRFKDIAADASKNKRLVLLRDGALLPSDEWSDIISDNPNYEIGFGATPNLERLANVITRKLDTGDKLTAVDAGLQAVRITVRRLASRSSPSLREFCAILTLAIDHGASIYNNGDVYGCARIYEAAAKAFCGLIRHATVELSDRQRVSINELYRVIDGKSHVSPEHADMLAWDLRHAFDAIIDCCFGGLGAKIVELLEARFAKLVEPSPGDIHRLILVTISEGAPLFNEGYHRDCAETYLAGATTAVELAKRMLLTTTSEPNLEYANNVIRRINVVLSDAEISSGDSTQRFKWALTHRPEKLARNLRDVFDSVLRADYLTGGGGRAPVMVLRNETLPLKEKLVFISYARADNTGSDESTRWLDRLLEQLAPFIRQEELDVWSDEELRIGDNWQDTIRERLEHARAAIVMISPAFLASKYIANSELPILLRKATEGGLTIIPMILSPCLYNKVRFKYPDAKNGPEEFTLSSIQAANLPSRTLEEMTRPEQNRVFMKVAEYLLQCIQDSQV